MLDSVIVSTDSKDIARIAEQYGAQVPFIRPSELAQDTTPDLPVFLHVIQSLSDDAQPGIVVWLRPTSPLRTREDIEGAINLLQDNPFDCVRSVTRAAHHPYWMKTLNNDGSMQPFIPGHDETVYYRRQMLPETYYLNGMVDVVRVKSVLEKNVLFGGNMGGYVTSGHRSIDIDVPEDLEIVRFLLEQNHSE